MGGHSSKEEMVEAYACRVDDMQDGEMKEISVGNYKALLVRDQGEYSAIGPKCTHYGAPLAKGSLKNGTVRCPWHGACFNVKTGDIEDYPGLDCVHRHEVVIQDGDKVLIRASKSALKSHKRYKPMVQIQHESGPHILIIGGGPTSVMCAETLRQKSFTGTITMATMDSYLPYDRQDTLFLHFILTFSRNQVFYTNLETCRCYKHIEFRLWQFCDVPFGKVSIREIVHVFPSLLKQL